VWSDGAFEYEVCLMSYAKYYGIMVKTFLLSDVRLCSGMPSSSSGSRRVGEGEHVSELTDPTTDEGCGQPWLGHGPPPAITRMGMLPRIGKLFVSKLCVNWQAWLSSTRAGTPNRCQGWTGHLASCLVYAVASSSVDVG
jgi:hypothetical protein